MPIGRQCQESIAYPRTEIRKRLAGELKARFNPRSHNHHVAIPPAPMRGGFGVDHFALQLFVVAPEPLVFAGEKRPDSGIHLIQIEFAPAFVDNNFRGSPHRRRDLVRGLALAIEPASDDRVEPYTMTSEPLAQRTRLFLADF
jgi:hypothetical protein